MTDEPCRGCRDRETPGGPLLLEPGLVIAARARNREPELPEATIEHARIAAMPTDLAGFPLVVIAPEDEDGLQRQRGYAAEFAKRGHPVYWLVATAGGMVPPGVLPPSMQVVRIKDGAPDGSQAATVAVELVNHLGIPGGVLVSDGEIPPEIARDLRASMDWRTVSGLGTEHGDIVLGREVAWTSGGSWPSRWAALDRVIRASFAQVSIIVLSFDNLPYNKLCLGSILANTEYPNYEVIFVDNGSTDGTVEWLQEMTRRFPMVRAIFNTDNRGFGPANNQGMAIASGELFLLLNNDTMVPPGWLSRLVLAMHLHPEVGLMGPSTNRTCNEAEVAVAYQTYGEFLAFAADRAGKHRGEVVPIRMLAMFCTAFRRSLYEELGPLDERYAVGMFEDEDYAVQARNAGHEIAWAPGVFIHHAYHASIGKLLRTGDYVSVYRANQTAFEEKWGICWERHRPPVTT